MTHEQLFEYIFERQVKSLTKTEFDECSRALSKMNEERWLEWDMYKHRRDPRRFTKPIWHLV